MSDRRDPRRATFRVRRNHNVRRSRLEISAFLRTDLGMHSGVTLFQQRQLSFVIVRHVPELHSQLFRNTNLLVRGARRRLRDAVAFEMSSLFGKKVDPKAESKQVKRDVRSSQREIDRELRDIDRREQQLVAEIRAEAKKGRSQAAVKILAKQLVQLRAQRDRMIGTRAQIGAIATQASAMASQVAVSGAIGSAGKAMANMNKVADTQKIGLTMQQFQRESEKMQLTEDMMGDMLSDAFDTDETEEETDLVVDQVLTEIGIEQTQGLTDAPTSLPTVAEKEESSEKQLQDLQAQLNAL